MDFHGPSFVIALVAICTVGWIINNWIRARHGYPLENEWSGFSHKTAPEQERKSELLAAENEQLKKMVVRLEDRLSVLERIATDQPNRLSAEIERLR